MVRSYLRSVIRVIRLKTASTVTRSLSFKAPPTARFVDFVENYDVGYLIDMVFFWASVVSHPSCHAMGDKEWHTYFEATELMEDRGGRISCGSGTSCTL
jgi:hypothetical protein